MSFNVAWQDGTVRNFETDDKARAITMAKSYGGLVASFEHVRATEPVAPEPENRMVDPKAKGTRKRKE